MIGTKVLSFLLLAVVGGVRAQDVDVLGTSIIDIDTAEPTGSPGVSELGTWYMPASSTAEVGGGGEGDVEVIGHETIGNSDSTVCYDGGSTTVPVVVDGDGRVPANYDCWRITNTGGGILRVPLPKASPSSENKTVTLVLPIVLSLVGVLAIGIVTLVLIRYRAKKRRESLEGEKRAWVARPGGWAPSNVEAGETPRY